MFSIPHEPMQQAAAPRAAVLALLTLFLSACGGGSGAPVTQTSPDTGAACDPDSATAETDCGVLYLAVTDADGDFLSYAVDVVSISMQRADGTRIETLPASTRVDFADYVELTEFVSARFLPPGRYVAGQITLDYSEADVLIERDGAAEMAIVVDESGTSLDTVTLDVQLVDDDPVVVTRGRVSLLTVDFDLAASHAIDLDVTPIVAEAQPFLIADIEPVDDKEVRVRGPLVSVSEAESSYTVALRPFHRRDGDFGRVVVNIDDETVFDVNGDLSIGSAGLAAMAALAQGTPTRALGILDVENRTFTADEVLAGDSAPGFDRDAARGHVIARDGNTLTLLGATLSPRNDRAWFNDEVLVTIGPDTRVSKVGAGDAEIGIDAISVGQRLLVVGDLASSDSSAIPLLDASNGAARLYPTRIGGTVNQAIAGQVDLDLVAIGGRSPERFNFSGTGASSDVDADPDNYEVATGALAIDGLVDDSPARMIGFPAVFGMAPPDFDAVTVVDYDQLPASVYIGWGEAGSTAPFLSIGPDGLVPDTTAFPDDARQTLSVGPRTIALNQIDGGIVIAGSSRPRTLYGIRDGDAVSLYRRFDDFSLAVGEALDGATPARRLVARGRYGADSAVLEASTIWLTLLP